jgi:two-component system cell cycle sensor histidine kinase/response regulator CckA
VACGREFQLMAAQTAGLPTLPLPAWASGGIRGPILVVEDESEVLALVTSVLRQFGYTVLAAASPPASLALMRDYPGAVHLVITDIIMPGMTGRQLAGEMERIRPGVRILYMSGYTRSEIGREGLRDEGLHFLQRPFTPDAAGGTGTRRAVDAGLTWLAANPY